ncbi:MAG TPA: hypothetical protein VFW65_13645 [Pseudonocardiaceae bacterium]|nr:hypothetical protein [Pseudonocardiaceae bacterium]
MTITETDALPTTDADRATGHATMVSTFATAPHGRRRVEARHGFPAQATG